MIETLEIRIAQNFNKKLEMEIEQVIKEVVKNSQGITMKLYAKSNLNSDYLIIMHMDNKHKSNKSILGQRIKAALKDYGLINHNSWIEVNYKNNKK